jgi:hypothetical protein
MTDKPETENPENQTVNNHKWGLDRKRFIVECFTLGFLVIYTSIAAYQAYLSKVSTDASTSAANTSKQALTTSERAFVYAKEANIRNAEKPAAKAEKPDPNRPIQASVTMHNSGQTAARNMIATINFMYGPGIRNDFNWPVGNTTQPILLAPQTDSDISIVLPYELLPIVQAGKTSLFLYGDIKYQDIFNQWHKTEFCFQYAGYSPKPDGKTIDKHLFFTGPVHNCADQDCTQ